jgi:hypothetical protein
MDSTVAGILRKHEYEYMQAINIYIIRKETDLRQLIHDFQAKSTNINLKDQKIIKLENTISKLRKQAFETGATTDKLNFKVKDIQQRYKAEREEKEFFHRCALDAKKEAKILKIAISRVQAEYNMLKEQNLANVTDLEFQISLHKQIKSVTSPISRTIENDGLTFMTKVDEDHFRSPTKKNLPSIRSSMQSQIEREDFFTLKSPSVLLSLD